MIAFLIAWALIGVVYFAGFMLEVLEMKNKPWTMSAATHSAVMLAMMVLLWPFWRGRYR